MVGTTRGVASGLDNTDQTHWHPTQQALGLSVFAVFH